MIDYQKAKIYKLVCNVSGNVYYGSTVQSLAKRKGLHKCKYLKWNANKDTNGYISSFEVIKNNNYDIILVENYPCNSKEELYSRERNYIENNECCNKNLPISSKKEWYENNKGKKIEYQKINKDKIKTQRKEHYENNKEIVKEKVKEYYVNNKDKILLKHSQYFECECGGKYTYGHKQRHSKTKLHQKYLSSLK
jgi:hypothetical protein